MRNIHQVINSLKRGLDPCLISDLKQGEGRGTQEGCRSLALFSIVVPLREWGSSLGEVPGVGSLLPACTSTDAATFFGIQ